MVIVRIRRNRTVKIWRSITSDKTIIEPEGNTRGIPNLLRLYTRIKIKRPVTAIG